MCFSDLAREVGGSKRTMWSHFASKAELFEAVMQDAAQRYRPILDGLGDGDLRDELTRFATAFAFEVTSAETLAIVRLVIAEGRRFPEIAAAFWKEGPGRTRQKVGAFLAARMAAGELRKDDALITANTLLNLIAGGLQQPLLWGLMLAPNRDAIATDACRAIDLFLRAYAPPGLDEDRVRTRSSSPS